MRLDDGQRCGPPLAHATSWHRHPNEVWLTPDRVGDAQGEVDLSPNGPPGPQAATLIAFAVAGRDVSPHLISPLVTRPYPLAPRDGDGMRVDAVRGAAAAILGPSSGIITVVPALRACVAPTSEDDHALADWFGWVLQPRPRWTHGDQTYTLSDDDRWLFLVGLVRSVDAEAFTWYRSGLVLLDNARGLDGRLDDHWRETWARLLDVRPGPRDWRDWHDTLLTALRGG